MHEPEYIEKDPNKRRAAFVEHTIRQKMREGAFDKIEGAGKPIPGIDQPYDEMWWIKQLVEREKLSVLPESLELKKEIETKLREIEMMTQERFVREELEALNQKIRRVNRTTVQGPSTTLVPLNVEAIIERWKQRKAEKKNTPIPPRLG